MALYVGPTPQEIEEYVSGIEHLQVETQQRVSLLTLLVLNRIEQDLFRLTENLSESPELDRIATTLSTIQHHGLTVEWVP